MLFWFSIFLVLICSLNSNFLSAFPVSFVDFELIVWSASGEISKKNQIPRRIGLDFSSILMHFVVFVWISSASCRVPLGFL